MLRRLFLAGFVLTSSLAIAELARASCVEVSISTCVGDFANGGDVETSNRLLGNTSGYSLGIIQHNRVSLFFASGTLAGQVSSATNAGFVGIWTDGVNQFPQFHLDIWGVTRSTGGLILGTTTPMLSGPGSATNYFMLVENGTFTITRPQGRVGIGTLTPSTVLDVVGTVNATAFTGNGAALTGVAVSGIYKTYDVVVTSAGGLTSNTTIRSNTQDGLNQALTLCGSMGLVNASTAPCNILYISTYSLMLGATIPGGVTVTGLAQAGQPVVWYSATATGTVLTNYGTLIGITLDNNSTTYTNTPYVAKSNSKWIGNNFRNTGTMMTNNQPLLRIFDSTNVALFENSFDSMTTTTSNEHSPFMVKRSTQVFVRRNNFTNLNGNAGADGFGISASYSREVYVEDNNITCTQLGCIAFTDNTEQSFLQRNSINVLAASPTRGTIAIWASDSHSISTGVVVGYNEIYTDATFTGTNSLICVGQCNDGASSRFVFGTVITGNKVYARAANTANFIKTANTDARFTIINDNMLFGPWGAFISDAGTATRYTTLGNFYNGIQQ